MIALEMDYCEHEMFPFIKRQLISDILFPVGEKRVIRTEQLSDGAVAEGCRNVHYSVYFN